MLRGDVFRLQAAKDEVRPTDIANILDHLEDLAATSNAAARAAALDIRDINQLSSSDMSRLYDYVALLGSPVLTKTQFLHRRMRDRDFMSRRSLEYILDLVDSAFGGTYAAVVRRDMATGSFFEMQDGVGSPLTDTGPAAITDLTSALNIPGEVAGPWPGCVARERLAGWGEYNSVTLRPTVGASQNSTTECVIRFSGFGIEAQEIASYTGAGTTYNALRLNTVAQGSGLQVALNAASVLDPGTWVAATAYVQGDRRRPVSNDSHVYEVEVAGTTSALIAGLQEVDVGGVRVGGDATGLANDATVYTATINPDGAGAQAIAITGSLAQTYTLLLSELNTDTTGATWSIIGGNVVCTSATTGEASTIAIVDTDVFATLTDFVAVNTAVVGDGEPTFPSNQGTVVDGTVTWRHVAAFTVFHDLSAVDALGTGSVGGAETPIVLDTWYHVVSVKNSTGYHLYLNGVLVDEILIPAADTIPGSFGLPVRWQYDTVTLAPTATSIGAQAGGSVAFTGAMAFLAIYDHAITVAQIAEHYQAAIDSGL